ncbi:hypothetical protein ACLIA0_15085 [Bacillaceae bacterium W0354]
MILQNERGLKGLETQPVIITDAFFNALCNIEKNFNSNETFTVINSENPREYNLNYVTHADLQVMTILFKVSFPQKGTINYVKRHAIYRKLKEYFEEPISVSQFYASFKKFELHNLISVSYMKELDLYNIQINHYLNQDTGKIGYFGVFSPVIFTKAFHSLSIGQKKLFYSFVIQQGNAERPIERMLKGEHEHIRFSGLQTFLHRKDNYHIRLMLEELKKPIYKGKSLFKQADLVKEKKSDLERKKFVKARFEIDSSWLVHYKQGQVEYHDPIEVPFVYPKHTSFIERLLNKLGIAELVRLNDGLDFKQMVRFLKNYSFRVIRHAIYHLKNFVDKNKSFPRHILKFLISETRQITEAQLLDIVRKANLDSFIAPNLKGEEKNRREFEFASAVSYYGPKALKVACKNAWPRLKALYMAPPEEKLTLKDYSGYPLLNRINGIEVVRKHAFRRRVDTIAYENLESTLARQYREQIEAGKVDSKYFITHMLEKVDQLPILKYVPDVTEEFKLENFLVKRQLFPII